MKIWSANSTLTTGLRDKSCSGRPITTTHAKHQVYMDLIFRENRHVKERDIALTHYNFLRLDAVLVSNEAIVYSINVTARSPQYQLEDSIFPDSTNIPEDLTSSSLYSRLLTSKLNIITLMRIKLKLMCVGSADEFQLKFSPMCLNLVSLSAQLTDTVTNDKKTDFYEDTDTSLERNYSFWLQTSGLNLSEFQNKVNDVTWYRTNSVVECADLVARRPWGCCKPLGFLYDSVSRVCQPVPWREGMESEVQRLSAGTSSLYRWRNTACKPGFQEYQYQNGNQTVTTCLVGNYNDRLYYQTAAKRCQDQGAFLASTKTLEKMALLWKLSSRMGPRYFWVGLDDRKVNKVFVWLEDGTVLSPEKTLELFAPGEPNHMEKEHCVSIRAPVKKLTDRRCVMKHYYFCETKPGC
ncbi:lectin C-type domain containing protein [Elysia marginata]|uniref:Lectin C-type domain containing protein n=1 Tax=Elysia marginata TaxID=1093978 RepID=A0AAV4FPI3_9GAST|nr:lectin C-type domain containing protein [Elysia marginata]